MKLTDGFRTQSSDGRTSQQSLVSKKVVHACINAPTASVLYTVTRQLNLRSLGVSTRITPTLTHTMTEGKVILVTGGTGLVGRAVQYISEQEPRPDESWVFAGGKDADLLSAESTKALFDRVKPTHVLHLAAKVGGLFANMVSLPVCGS